MTTWHNCDSLPTATSIGGGPGAGLTADVYVQGTGAVGRRASSGVHGFLLDLGAVDFTPAGRYLWVWLNVPLGPGGLATLANGGLRVRVGTTTADWAEWFVGGGDVTKAGWKRYVIDLVSAPSATGGAGLNRASVRYVGPVCNWASVPGGNLPHYVIDMISYGGALTVTGGTAGDRLKWADIAAYTEHPDRAWGVLQERSGVYYCNGAIRIGPAYMQDSGAILIWESQEYYQSGAVRSSVPDTLQGLAIVGATEFQDGTKVGAGDSMSGTGGSLLRAAAGTVNKLHLDASDSNVVKVLLYGTTIAGATQSVAFSASGASHELAGIAVTGSAQVQSGNVITRNCVFGSTVPVAGSHTAALRWNASINIKDCQFLGNSDPGVQIGHGIEHAEAGSFVYDGLVFSGNEQDVLFSASAGNLTIQAVDGANPATYTNLSSGSVSIENPRFFEFTVANEAGDLLTGYEWRLYVADPTPGKLGSTELAGQESATASTQLYPYNYDSDREVVLQILHSDYVEHITEATLKNADLSTAVVLQKEENI